MSVDHRTIRLLLPPTSDVKPRPLPEFHRQPLRPLPAWRHGRSLRTRAGTRDRGPEPGRGPAFEDPPAPGCGPSANPLPAGLPPLVLPGSGFMTRLRSGRDDTRERGTPGLIRPILERHTSQGKDAGCRVPSLAGFGVRARASQCSPCVVGPRGARSALNPSLTVQRIRPLLRGPRPARRAGIAPSAPFVE